MPYTGSDIYDLFKIFTDGEEFASDTDAMIALDMADIVIRSERDWELLKKSVALPLGTASLAAITDKEKLLVLWAVTGPNFKDKQELKQAPWKDRFNPEYDWYYDPSTDSIIFTITTIPTNWLSYILDYKYVPDTITLTTTPIFPEISKPLYAYELVRIFKRADADFDFYKEYGDEYEFARGLLIDNNESLAQR